MGVKAGARKSHLKTFLFGFLFVFSLSIFGTCGSDKGADSGLSPGAGNVGITGVISSSVEPPDGLAQAVDAGGCGAENFVCTVTLAGPDGAVLNTEQVIVSLSTCLGRPVNGSTFEMGTFSVASEGGFTIDVECLNADASLLDEFLNNFSGNLVATLGADGTTAVVITLSNLFDFATSAEALGALQGLGCPVLTALDGFLECEASGSLEDIFSCEGFKGLVQQALVFADCIECEDDCESDDDCSSEGFVCNKDTSCCKCSQSCQSGACKDPFQCDKKTNCCVQGESCDQPCGFKSPSCPPSNLKEPQTCNFLTSCCEPDTCADCSGACPPAQTCVKGKEGACCEGSGTCGDGITTPPEVCDGDQKPPCKGICLDSCTSCCGNGVLTGKEACDPPGSECGGGAGVCSDDCRACDPAGPECGNGIQDKGEACEKGDSGVCGELA